ELAANLRASPGMLPALAWSADGRSLAAGSVIGSVQVWDAGTAKPVRELTGGERAVWAVAFSPDGTRIVGGGDDRAARVWDANTGQLIDTLRGHTLTVRVAGFAPDGTVVTGGDDGSVRFW